MTAPLTNGSIDQRKVISNTITGLKRWSCHSKDLPPIEQVKALHVYDFDNTLFRSPLPNQKLWDSGSVGLLQSQKPFINGGWWHDHHILEATGEGIEKEEQRAWENWWNEHIVELVELSEKQNDALTILLTGRAEHNFADLIKRIVGSRNLSFDMICLKPRAGPNNQNFSSTMMFKQAILKDLVHTYKDADEIRIYEDRPHHTKQFREFFKNFNQDLLSPTAPTPRKPITAEVIQVADQVTTLDPITEATAVQRMINEHNSQTPRLPRGLTLKRTVFYTGYLIHPSDTAKLLTFVKLLPRMAESDMKFLANNILISHGPAQPFTLTKVGGIGYKQTWQVTGFGFSGDERSRVWAARVAPVPPVSVVHTDNHVPFIILAAHKDTPLSHANRIQSWQPVSADNQYVIETLVGEKVQLRIEAESEDTDFESLFDRKHSKRRHSPSSFQQQNHPRGGYGNEENKRQNGNNASFKGNQRRGRGGDGGRGANNNNNRGGGRGGGAGRGSENRRGRGGQRGGYKSLDDMGTGGGRHNAMRGEPNYDDYVPGGGGYDATFPSTKGMGLDGAGGLPYGK